MTRACAVEARSVVGPSSWALGGARWGKPGSKYPPIRRRSGPIWPPTLRDFPISSPSRRTAVNLAVIRYMAKRSCPREYRIDGRVPTNWQAHHQAVVKEAHTLAAEAARKARKAAPPVLGTPPLSKPGIQTSQGPSRGILVTVRTRAPCTICPEEMCPVCGWGT